MVRPLRRITGASALAVCTVCAVLATTTQLQGCAGAAAPLRLTQPVVLLGEVGVAGQQKLKAARILIVGAGGLGSPAALYLAAAGIGRIGLIDGDRVDASNLQRQVLFDTADVGRPKASRGAGRLRALNPLIDVVAHDEELRAGNAASVLAGYDLVIDGSKIFSHYTKTARLMKVFDAKRDCRDATAEEKDKGAWRVVHGKVCSPAPKDHWGFEDFKSDDIPRLGIAGVKWHAVDKDGKDRVRWAYRYGEQYGAGGYMHTNMSDSGADAYEVTQNLVRRFDLGYPWAYFRRGSREFNAMFLPQSTTSRYFSRVRAYHWQIATDLGRAATDELADDDGMRPYVMAQNDIFSFLTRAVLMPEPGDYSPSTTRTPVDGKLPIYDLKVSGAMQTPTAFTLGIGDGRYVGEDFDNTLGGSWDYQKYVNHAGFEVEKAMAMLQIIDPRPTLFTVARENFLDGRATKISFRADLPDATDRLLGGVLAEDWETIAPGVVDATQGVSLPLDLAKKSVVRPQGSKVLFPNIGYKQQLAMGLYAVMFSRLNSDMTLANKMRIWMAGDPAPAVPGTREVRFADPKSGYTYVANRYGDDVIDGKTVDRGVASRMLAHANQLLAATYKVDAPPDDEGKVKKRPALLSDYMPSPFKNDQEARSAQNGALPPDLSLITKARGVESNAPFYMFPIRLLSDIVTGYQEAGSDYVYSFITGYAEPPKGFTMGDFMNYNTAFPGNQTAMPNPFAGGDNLFPYDDGTPATVDNYARDVTAFLMWAAEPKLEQRKRIGMQALLFLAITSLLLWLAKRRLWANVPH